MFDDKKRNFKEAWSNVELGKELKQQAQAIADSRGLGLSTWIRQLVIDGVGRAKNEDVKEH